MQFWIDYSGKLFVTTSRDGDDDDERGERRDTGDDETTTGVARGERGASTRRKDG